MAGVQNGTYALDRSVGYAGQLQNPYDANIQSAPAASAIRAGAAVELVNGALQECQSGNLTDFVGVALYRASKEPGTYAQYDVVPYVRRGRVYALYSGGTKGSDLAAINIANASTGGTPGSGTNIGTFTQSGTSTSTGSEITAAPSGVKERTENTGSSTLCLVELNLP